MRYREKLPSQETFYASYGLFVHRLIERYYRGEIAADELPGAFLGGFSEEVRGERPSEKITENYIRAGADYFRSFRPFPFAMLGVERRVRFRVGGNAFVGVIDYIGRADSGGLVLIDHKSRAMKPRSPRKTPTEKDRELDTMLRQLYLYAAAVREEFGEFPEKLCFNCFRTGVFIEEPFREEAFRKALAWAEEQVSAIQKAEEFPPRPEYFRCRYLCGMRDRCEYAEFI